MANSAESFKQSRMPERPTEAHAAKGGGEKSKTPPLGGYSGCHIPYMGETITAAKPGKKADGMASWAVMKPETRNPVRAESYSKRKGS